MDEQPSISVRRKKRYNHVTISLKLRCGDHWEQINALDWNEDGLNFYISHQIHEETVTFKKGSAVFTGKTVWHYKNDSDNVILEIILNELLFKQLKRFAGDKTMVERVVRMTRAQGKVLEKMRLLEVLKYDISDDELRTRIDTYKREHPLYRYGVRIESEEWKKIVDYTLEISSAALHLDKLGQTLSEINKDITG